MLTKNQTTLSLVGAQVMGSSHERSIHKGIYLGMRACAKRIFQFCLALFRVFWRKIVLHIALVYSFSERLLVVAHYFYQMDC